ncbi:phosphomethylpyrimidine kinase [Thermococcus peptonophilus]|uniref:Bifunctional thiamine biosynthesis protein ThiDN n=2 Tax=Thermococcus peptonophilus TaxID=53952 RepID=A0A142CTH5_9EURY|nr:phosphomethylpyrimidine kinase [Thermococcus peptonophilus]
MAVLIIAGLDTGGGAGLKADIETVSALGEHPLPVVSAITYQNPDEVRGVFPVPPNTIREQIRAVKGVFEIRAVKIGLLHGGAVKVIAEETKGLIRVLDPVIASSSGFRFLSPEDVEILKRELLPGSIVTPNVPEAEVLTGLKINSIEDIKRVARVLVEELGAEAAIVKGGHLNFTDVLYWNGEVFKFSGERVEGFTHGTGCVFSSALAAFIAKGLELPKAVERAKRFVEGAIRFSGGEGEAVNPLWELQRDTQRWMAKEDLEKAVGELVKLGELLNPHVAEVGTNFALATDFGEVFAVKGRIVRYGKTIKPVGPVELNASDHLRRALLKMREFYPEVRAVINLRYSEKLIKRAEKLGLKVSFYDRREEPEEVKRAERGTMEWGIESAVKRLGEKPNVIYHLGDWGKEPMILVFGRNAEEIVERIRNLIFASQ